MKRRISKKIVVILAITSAALFAAIVIVNIVFIFAIGGSMGKAAETLLEFSVSPNGKYHLEAYRSEPGATVDFPIKIYMIDDGAKKLIYDAYHEYSCDIEWSGNDTVVVNRRELDMSKGETFRCDR